MFGTGRIKEPVSQPATKLKYAVFSYQIIASSQQTIARMDTIIAVRTNPIQPLASAESSKKDECLYCLESRGFLLLNKMCPCKYKYHVACQLKSVSENMLKCPLCRCLLTINIPTMNIQSSQPVIIQFINNPEQRRRTHIFYDDCSILFNFVALVCLVVGIIIPIILYYTR